MEKFVERRKVNPYEVIAEKVYWISFAFTLFLIVVGTIVTAIFRKTVSPDIVIIPKEILDFTEHILWVFALPVSLKIGGDALPQAIAAWKGVSMQQGFGQTGFEQGQYGQSVVVENFQPNVNQPDRMQGQFDPNNIPHNAKRQE